MVFGFGHEHLEFAKGRAFGGVAGELLDYPKGVAVVDTLGVCKNVANPIETENNGLHVSHKQEENLLGLIDASLFVCKYLVHRNVLCW